MLVTCAVRVHAPFIVHTGVCVHKQSSYFHEVLPPVVEPVAPSDQSQTSTYNQIGPPLTGPVGTGEKASSPPPV